MAGAWPWLFATLYFPALQVVPLYLFAHRPRSDAVYERMAATAVAVSAGGWLPTAWRLEAAARAGEAPPSLAAALGLRSAGLLAACALPLALMALLFAGPLLAAWLDRQGGRRASASAGAATARRLASLPLPVRLRNWVMAPLLEEFLFRGCLVSFLLASGVRPSLCVVLSPLLFAACHLHHLYDLVRFQRLPISAAARQVAFQFSYSSIFGVLAAFFFVRSGHLAAAVLPHAFCNVMGPPAVPPRGAPHRRPVVAALVGGVLAFFCLLRPMTAPTLFANVPTGDVLQ